MCMSKIHFVIPDTQITPWSNTAHVGWIGQYLIDQFADKDVTVIHLGDHWDMASLCSYEKGKRVMEGRRYVEDVEAGNAAMALLVEPLLKYQHEQRQAHKKIWNPRRVLLRGNHEERILRATQEDATLEGALGYHHLLSPGWEVHDFLEVVDIDGVKYSHFFTNNATGRPLGGMIETRIKNVGCSFTMGHQQGLKMGMLETVTGRRRGLIAGSCYLDTMDYRGPQGRDEWRGILVCHEVADGDYCLMEVSLSYLCKKYEGVSLDLFLGKS